MGSKYLDPKYRSKRVSFTIDYGEFNGQSIVFKMDYISCEPIIKAYMKQSQIYHMVHQV